MSFTLYFFAGFFLGFLGWYFSRKKSRSEILKLNEQKIKLQQEKEIVVDFMHNLAVAIGEGVARKDLYQRIAHTAVITTRALST